MREDDFHWPKYYQRISGRKPRQILLDALEYFPQDTTTPRKAIDLGCGDGTETAYLLANGWHVFATDSEPAAFEHFKEKIPPDAQDRLQTQVAKFEEVVLSPADLIHASYSLPFCHPQHFVALWNNIVDNINPQGRFAGELFGVHDTWASNTDMTFFTEEQARALFADFEIERFDVEDKKGASTIGLKHWHVFHVIARKK